MLSFHFGLEDQACKIRENQSCGDSHRAGGKASHKESDQSVLREWKPDLIVPVPVHRSKERQRGFNQAAYLAEKLGHYTGISTDVNIVQKVLKTKSQKKLNALQRRKNLEKAFCVTGDVRGKNILVIDDVYTTGSTIDAMAGCLKRKGAGNVYFLTVCIGRR